jgi:uncharacterized protein (TIGR02466 family)
MNIINLFSVPILAQQLSNPEQLKKEEVDILKKIELDKQYGDDGNYLSKDSHILDKYKLSRITNICDKYVKQYTDSILGITDEFKMFKSWLSMNVTGTRHEPHSHRNTMISCILYFDEYMSDQVMAPISFWHDGLDQIFKTFQFSFNVKNQNQYNNKVLTIYPKTNTMIVFPGWLRHETEIAKSSIERYCLGANYFFNGESSTGYHNITINVK